ncbi:hypothetical protein GCM10012288_17280 [Malaciobacter pacificus]|uniref:Uncharacterized protein n=1 Tax=Malaciobacter pacificus TaxID=1080223 RepID=A0A5C2HC21_9BACT|nr:hypothetical protein [Malaciobacter pacificus]QEP34766.1 hypothetical protein APAC_1670 [Malaciobacter pacificus]GGD43540.1 hypothetical protein GCM10012288_17280 [Malaciobacter pacificus]
MNYKTIIKLKNKLDETGQIEFEHSNLYYEIFISDDDYVINIYSSNEKDEDDEYIIENIVDGGVYSGDSLDAIKFML